MTRSPALAAVVFGLCALALGCDSGPDYRARGTVKGKVSFGKKNLNFGTVVFHGANNMVGSSPIDIDGNYEIKDAPLGECSITVTVGALPVDPNRKGGPGVPEMKDPNAGGDAPPRPLAPKTPSPKDLVRIDAKYSNPGTSGLKFTVIKGEQHVHNIDL
jgi:hypothetical protein